ncbi:hypothetical protein VC83_00716 [Pseudogymnoascus destructans]|nr:uncharacterized protein VC83_00716 [Pseudogymnoascus destructans]OAF62395.1 hypothetical protein VC83_00716 [Pseudogymnoascus destructans]
MRYGGAEVGYRGGDGFAPPAQRRRTDSGVATDNPPVKSPLAEDVGPSMTTTNATPGRRAPLPPYPPPAASAAWRVASPPKSEEEKERELASYYRRPLAVGVAAGEGVGAGVMVAAARMPLPSVAARVGSADEGRGAAGGSPASSVEKRPKRRELSKEQREHAAAVRRLGACGECKARKVKCSPSHHRGSPGLGGRGSGSPGPTGSGGCSNSPGRGGGGGSVGLIVRKRKSESPAPVMHMGMSMLSRRASPDAADDDDGVDGEVLVVAVEE